MKKIFIEVNQYSYLDSLKKFEVGSSKIMLRKLFK